jgi:hypothetical protein
MNTQKNRCLADSGRRDGAWTVDGRMISQAGQGLPLPGRFPGRARTASSCRQSRTRQRRGNPGGQTAAMPNEERSGNRARERSGRFVATGEVSTGSWPGRSGQNGRELGGTKWIKDFPEDERSNSADRVKRRLGADLRSSGAEDDPRRGLGE